MALSKIVRDFDALDNIELKGIRRAVHRLLWEGKGNSLSDPFYIVMTKIGNFDWEGPQATV